jgi:hypothetical protein
MRSAAQQYCLAAREGRDTVRINAHSPFSLPINEEPRVLVDGRRATACKTHLVHGRQHA